MIRSLEALGLVRRERDYLDRRQIVLSVTSEGLDRIRAAYALFVERRTAERVIRSALGDEPPRHEPLFGEPTAPCAMDRLGKLLDQIRGGFGDRAELDYPRRWIGFPYL
jgi:DNA-binding MarR family transcriptional regulator